MQPVLPNYYPGQGASNPPQLPPRGTRGTSSPANAEVGLWDQFTTQVTRVYNTLLSDQPSILILPKDVMNHIFTNITDEKDLVSFSITCTTLSRMKLLPDAQLRILCFKAVGQTGDKLIHAVNSRPLDSLECGLLGIYNDGIPHRNKDLCKIQSAITLQIVLFENFRNLCLKNKITGKDFYFVAMAVPRILKKKAASFDNKEVLLLKLKSVIKKFNGDICLYRIDTYAKQSIDMITPDSFHAHVAELKEFLPHINKIDIEDRLRSRIKSLQNKDEIAALANEYLDPSPNNKKIEFLKCALKAGLEKSKDTHGLTEEQLYEIETKLAHIDATALMEAQKLGQFYQEILNA